MKHILAAFILVLALTTPSFAASASTSSTPNPADNSVLAGIQKSGAKLFYLGRQVGLDGWFIVKQGQVQIIYVTPDNKGALVGALFGENGENITVTQVSNLVRDNKEIANLITSAEKEQAAIAQAGAPPPAAAKPEVVAGTPTTPLSPGERLIQDLSGAATVVVGKTSSPELLMVMDPNCRHCQATWKVLRDSVVNGNLHIRMIPIGSEGTDNERAAAMLLGVADPLAVWDSYVSGDRTQLAGTPTPNALIAVKANHALIDRWNIENTPYLVYRAKDGKVKVLQGEPGKVSVVLSDMGL